MLKLTGTGEISNIIDVSKCDAYKDEHCKYQTAIMFTEYNLCSNFPNCYYRQLKKCEAKLEKIEETCKYKETLDEIKKWNKDIRKVIEGAEDDGI